MRLPNGVTLEAEVDPERRYWLRVVLHGVFVGWVFECLHERIGRYHKRPWTYMLPGWSTAGVRYDARYKAIDTLLDIHNRAS